MKRILSALLVALLCGVSFAWAQGEGKRRRVIFVEMGGLSKSVFSLNFDTRLGKSHQGLGWRVGASYYQSRDLLVATLPLGLNYLLGKTKHHLELGVGLTPIYARNTPPENYDYGGIRDGLMGLVYGTRRRQECFLLDGSLTFGYRFQKPNGGFHWGAGLTPTLGVRNERFFFQPFVPYLTLGYCF